MTQDAQPRQAPDPSVISLVLTLHADPALQSAALAALAANPEVEIGPRRGLWLPIVATVPDARAFHAWVESLEGVVFADVAFVELPAMDAPTGCDAISTTC
jgi:hypothetical protein